MNYILQINAFWNFKLENKISANQITLYFAILNYANWKRWEKKVKIPNAMMMYICGISKQSLWSARNRLVELGLITYTHDDGKDGIYEIVTLYDEKKPRTTCHEADVPIGDLTEDLTGDLTEDLTGDLTLNKTINNKTINKKQKVFYKEEVSLNEREYDARLSDYGEDILRMTHNKPYNYKIGTG